jgi:hypothetical protein
MLDLAGERLCMFIIMWGDGAFPVEADLDAAGRMVCPRIEIGLDETVARLRDMKDRWFGEVAQRTIVSARVARDGEPVRFLYRDEAPDRPDNSGWRVFAGDETDEYSNAPGNAVVLPLRDLLDREAGLKEVFRTPARCAFERRDAKAPFGRIEDYDVGDATLR